MQKLLKPNLIWYLILTMTIVYVVGAGIGAFAAKELDIELTPNPTKLEFSTVIFHNLTVVGYLAVGVLTLGIATLAIIFINGSALGITLGVFSSEHYFSQIVLALVPHGVLEIPAFIIAGAGDLMLVYSIILLLRKKKRDSKVKFKKGLLLNLIAIALVVIAGVIEVIVPVPDLPL